MTLTISKFSLTPHKPNGPVAEHPMALLPSTATSTSTSSLQHRPPVGGSYYTRVPAPPTDEFRRNFLQVMHALAHPGVQHKLHSSSPRHHPLHRKAHAVNGPLICPSLHAIMVEFLHLSSCSSHRRISQELLPSHGFQCTLCAATPCIYHMLTSFLHHHPLHHTCS